MSLIFAHILRFLLCLADDCKKGFTISYVIASIVGVSVVVSYLTYEPNICLGLDSNSTEDLFIPHNEDCTKCYKCDNGDLVSFDCLEELEWNDEDKICDKPVNAGSSTIEPCDTVDEPVCPEHDPNKPAVHLANPKDCGSFYLCDWGVAYLVHCPGILHFNAKLQVCDYPENANCVIESGCSF